MIRTASFFYSQNHYGILVPISRSVPDQYKGLHGTHPLQTLLAPSAELLRWWKKQESRHIDMSWEFPNDQVIEQYTDRYREEIRENKDAIAFYLQNADPAKDETWLCWEPPGDFCHRNLAYKLVETLRPDCAGGQDVEPVQPVVETLPSNSITVGDRVCLIFAPLYRGEVLSVSPARVGAFPAALGIEATARLRMESGAIAWWKPGQLRKI